jgi:hypothetical protein
MKVIQRILRNLRLCTGVPALCDFIFMYGHGYSKFACLTKILFACITLKPPTVWRQVGKDIFLAGVINLEENIIYIIYIIYLKNEKN